MSPRRHGLRPKSFVSQAPAARCRCRVDGGVPRTAWNRLPSASLGSTNGISIVQTCNLTYCTGGFRHGSPDATGCDLCFCSRQDSDVLGSRQQWKAVYELADPVARSDQADGVVVDGLCGGHIGQVLGVNASLLSLCGHVSTDELSALKSSRPSGPRACACVARLEFTTQPQLTGYEPVGSAPTQE